jgi:zona occludens toxin
MATLISAPIRTGKTLYVIKCIFDELNKGRQVFTNIVGIKIDGVISVTSDIGDPFDWRNLPNGSVLVWDEAHEHPAFAERDLLKDYKLDDTKYNQDVNDILKLNITQSEKKAKLEALERNFKHALVKKKEQIRDIGYSLLMHGHFGIEIYFITQRPNKLNPDVLAAVTTHYVMRRKFGMDAAFIWEFGEAMTTWSKSTADIALNKKLWRYPKYLYKFYTSSENHQVRKSFPLKYLAFALIPLALFGFGFSKAKETGFFGLFPKEQKTVSNQQNTEKPYMIPADKKPQLCTYDNINTPYCQAQQKAQMASLNTEIKRTIYYNTGDPYQSYVPSTIALEQTDFPRLSGCIKYNGKYHGIDQQGNQMNNATQEACRRWIEDGQRPFDYFKNQNGYQEPPQNDRNGLTSTETLNNVSTQLIQPK